MSRRGQCREQRWPQDANLNAAAAGFRSAARRQSRRCPVVERDGNGEGRPVATEKPDSHSEMREPTEAKADVLKQS